MSINRRIGKYEIISEIVNQKHRNVVIVVSYNQKKFIMKRVSVHSGDIPTELSAYHELRRHKFIPVVYEMIKIKEMNDMNGTYLIFEYLEDYIMLSNKNTLSLTYDQKRGLCDKIVTTLRLIHSLGRTHQDIHSQNVLYRFVEGKPEIKLIDFESSKGSPTTTDIESDMKRCKGMLTSSLSKRPERDEDLKLKEYIDFLFG
jgi:serine/threonine protein kinase